MPKQAPSKPSPPSRAEINADLERSMRELGIREIPQHETVADEVYDAAVERAKSLGRAVSACDLAHLPYHHQTIIKKLNELSANGRMFRRGSNRRLVFIPNVVG